jgi:hypothetical protein
LSFLYVALCIAGMTWVRERWGARRELLLMLLKTVLALDMLAHMAMALQAFWLPAVDEAMEHDADPGHRK